MNVIIDSPIWSLAFRRRTASAPEVGALAQLIQANAAHLIGPIRQEVLSGIREPARFERIREAIELYNDLPLSRHHYEMAAEFSNQCRARGIQGSSTDFLICAVSHLESLKIFTTDRDFEHFARILPITLFGMRS